MQRGYVDTTAGQMHYRTTGDGPALLLLHAATHSGAQFGPVMEDLGTQFRVLAPDLPGFGNSDPLDPGTTVPELAELLVEFLEALDADPAHVFGLHTGNKIGTALGARYPEHVDRLILSGHPHSLIPDEERRDDVIASRNPRLLDESDTPPGTAALLADWGSLHAKLTDKWWNERLFAGKEVTAATFDWLAERAIATLQSRNTLPACYRANFAYDLRADLS